MAGLSHRDVALLNSSLEGLGNTFMQNRLLDEKMKEREDERTFRQTRADAEDQYRRDTTAERERHNKAMEGGKVSIWAQTGDEPNGGYFQWSGTPDELKQLRASDPKIRILSGPPKEITPDKPSVTIMGPGGRITYHPNTPQDLEDATKVIMTARDVPGAKYQEVKDPSTGKVIWSGVVFPSGAHENPEKEKEPTISDTTSTEIDPLTKQPIIKSSRTVRGTPAQVEKYKPVIPEHDKKGKADGSRFKIIGTK